MAKVLFTPALKRFIPDIASMEVDSDNVADIFPEIEAIYPGLSSYLLEDNGALRQHVNIFINNIFIRDRQKLSDPVQSTDEIYIIQALSGG